MPKPYRPGKFAPKRNYLTAEALAEIAAERRTVEDRTRPAVPIDLAPSDPADETFPGPPRPARPGEPRVNVPCRKMPR